MGAEWVQWLLGIAVGGLFAWLSWLTISHIALRVELAGNYNDTAEVRQLIADLIKPLQDQNVVITRQLSRIEGILRGAGRE